jgi:hypothetical protein
VNGTATASNTNSPKTATASCSSGKVALGGGFLIAGSGSSAAAGIASYPSANDTWTANAIKITGNPNFSLQAFVICATQ